MIFTRTCDNTRKMALMLRNLGFDAIPIHGQMAQAKRIGALNKFKAGERSILCATGGALHSVLLTLKWALACCANFTQVRLCISCECHPSGSLHVVQMSPKWAFACCVNDTQ